MTYTFTPQQLVILILAIVFLTILAEWVFIALCYLVSRIRNPFKKQKDLTYQPPQNRRIG